MTDADGKYGCTVRIVVKLRPDQYDQLVRHVHGDLGIPLLSRNATPAAPARLRGLGQDGRVGQEVSEALVAVLTEAPPIADRDSARALRGVVMPRPHHQASLLDRRARIALVAHVLDMRRRVCNGG
jgi:hypothetical protein